MILQPVAARLAVSSRDSGTSMLVKPNFMRNIESYLSEALLQNVKKLETVFHINKEPEMAKHSRST